MLGPYWVGDVPRDTVDVEITRDGAPLDLTGYSEARVELTTPSGAEADVSGVLVEMSGSTVSVTWPQSSTLFVQPGIYSLAISLVSGVGMERVTSVLFEVRPSDGAAVQTLAPVSLLEPLLDGSFSDEKVVSALSIASMLVRSYTGRTASWKTAVPPTVAHATALIAKRVLTVPTVEVTETIGPFRTTTKAGSMISETEKALLAPYRRRSSSVGTLYATVGGKPRVEVDNW